MGVFEEQEREWGFGLGDVSTETETRGILDISGSSTLAQPHCGENGFNHPNNDRLFSPTSRLTQPDNN